MGQKKNRWKRRALLLSKKNITVFRLLNNNIKLKVVHDKLTINTVGFIRLIDQTIEDGIQIEFVVTNPIQKC